MIDEVTMTVNPAERTEKRMNAVSKTFPAGLHNLPVICRDLTGSIWPTVCAAVVLLGGLAMPTWMFSDLAGGTYH